MLFGIAKDAIMVTGFVLVMMLIIEYINVQTKGKWSNPIKKSGTLQILIAMIMGLAPGCLGTFTVVSLYTHNIISFGALVAAMIATFGDEAFFMLSMIPSTAAKLMLVIGGIALISGFLVNLAAKSRFFRHNYEGHLVHDHHQETGSCNSTNILRHFRKISFHRAILLFGLLLLIIGIFAGELVDQHDLGQGYATVMIHEHSVHDHDHENGSKWDWVRITFLMLSLTAFLIVSVVSDHFLEEHLWGHIIKKHFMKILLWTFGTLLCIGFLMQYVSFDEWVRSNLYAMLILALAVGLIPQSGPHLLFLSLFMTGAIPFSILLANSIVQDGHGGLPLLAESKRSFLAVKGIKLIIAALVGVAGILLQY